MQRVLALALSLALPVAALVATSPATPGVAATATAEPACGSGLEPGRQTIPVMSGGFTYPVLVHLPDGFEPGRRLPMVLNLHGATQSGAQSLNDSELEQTSDKYDFVIVSPDGGAINLPLPASLPAGYFWNVPGIPFFGFPTPPGARDDEQFLLDVVSTVKRRLCIKERRVYVEGASNGAMMTSYLACHHADVFAAAGAVSGIRAGRAKPDDPQRIDRKQCRPARPIPVIAIHGKADPLVPYEGNDSAGWGYSVERAVARWAKLNKCTSKPRSRRVTETVTRTSWRGCRADVALVASDIGGHTWYGHQSVVPYELFVGANDMSIDNNEILWRFFRKHRLPR